MLPKLPRPTPQATSRPHPSPVHCRRGDSATPSPHTKTSSPAFLPSRPNCIACSILHHFRCHFVRSAWQVELRAMWRGACVDSWSAALGSSAQQATRLWAPFVLVSLQQLLSLLPMLHLSVWFPSEPKLFFPFLQSFLFSKQTYYMFITTLIPVLDGYYYGRTGYQGSSIIKAEVIKA